MLLHNKNSIANIYVIKTPQRVFRINVHSFTAAPGNK
nr:MAG TPA: 3-dehydroquinate synthase II [Caudoviricetes sp.]